MGFKGGRHLTMGCLYALLGFDFLAWGVLAGVGFSLRQGDRYWSLHAPYYAWLPAKVALCVMLAAGFLAVGPRFGRLRTLAAPAGCFVEKAALIKKKQKLLFY